MDDRIALAMTIRMRIYMKSLTRASGRESERERKPHTHKSLHSEHINTRISTKNGRHKRANGRKTRTSERERAYDCYKLFIVATI